MTEEKTPSFSINYVVGEQANVEEEPENTRESMKAKLYSRETRIDQAIRSCFFWGLIITIQIGEPLHNRMKL
ncbi:hypothetical protein [Hydrogenivirga sp. 128-5-R1-1]|uniref:hypothetical protein n=1 Tax=Hydrogenivirga sp. 128-5-R1-1 TaxID=392423 RepID=UPI00015EF0AC|nr:hypothetical protein [Hydrogenivirga sp. 128-5-R1-1]EDP74685.1 hypothetical protein HG1285_14774 [Hydrogenivirga sp. 128-5-R1-1]